jgi:hypothetical protein
VSHIRLLTGLVSVTLIVLGLVALLPDCASACSCSSGGVPFRVIAKGADAGAVFSGEVMDVEEGPPTRMLGLPRGPSMRVTLQVSEVWKGPQRDTLEVSTPRDGATCGYYFKEGEKYLVYAYGKEEPLKVSLCSETRLLSKAHAHLRVLGDGWNPGEESALSDTSGGFPRLDVIGMLGLAVAAVSLAVLMRIVRTG